MQRVIVIVILIAAVVLAIALYRGQQQPPRDFAAMAQPALATMAIATTDEDRLTAILAARESFAEIVRAIDDEADANLALPQLDQLASDAKRLDDELKQNPDSRKTLFQRRQAELDASAMTMGNLMIATVFKIKITVIILDPLEKITDTL